MSHVTYSFVTGTGNGNGNGNDSCDSLSHNGNPLGFVDEEELEDHCCDGRALLEFGGVDQDSKTGLRVEQVRDCGDHEHAEATKAKTRKQGGKTWFDLEMSGKEEENGEDKLLEQMFPPLAKQDDKRQKGKADSRKGKGKGRKV